VTRAGGSLSVMPNLLRIVTGVLLILLGAWGGLAHFVGPYFHYAYTSDTAWHVTAARVWLEIVPAAAAVAGGALVLVTTRRLLSVGGAILTMLAGGWLVVGRAASEIWRGVGTVGVPAGTSPARMASEELGMFTGLGLVIALCAALVLGRALTSASQAVTGPDAVKDAKEKEGGQEAEEETDEEAGALVGPVLTEDFGTASHGVTRPRPASVWQPPG
jgi:hypothetical protein